MGNTIIDRSKIPDHVFSIAELDFSDDLFSERVPGSWVRLAARTLKSPMKAPKSQDDIFRQCILLSPKKFTKIFKKLESIGNVMCNLGKPVVWTRGNGKKIDRHYSAFHDFVFPLLDASCEPLVFLYSNTSIAKFFINPDLWMYLELEEKSPGKGIWWDPRSGIEALVHRVTENGCLETVEIRPQYLLRYLYARQMSLIIAHYHQMLLFNPAQVAIKAFTKSNLVLGSARKGVKVILQNWGSNRDSHSSPYLQRRLHLWFEIKPPVADDLDPWLQRPTFDPFSFTLPTSAGPVAPARWKGFPGDEERTFKGISCKYLDRIFFRQEVLTKYQGNSSYEVKDDGSVSCYHWSLDRSTSRIGNELIETAIGDFAEGVPFEEWPHWKEYAVEPPSLDILKSLAQEISIPKAVNVVVGALIGLNGILIDFAAAFGISMNNDLWMGSVDSLAGRQLKWVYLDSADDDEFLKRAALASTLFLDGIQPAPLRNLLRSINNNLHQTFDKTPQSLQSRNLLQRTTLIALLIAKLLPELQEIPKLVQIAEGKIVDKQQPDLQTEVQSYYRLIRSEFAPLSFLYDLRVNGGLAHPPNAEAVALNVAKLGLPSESWHRTDYLHLLKIISLSIKKIASRLRSATAAIQSA